MFILKCDLCKKEIKNDKEVVTAGAGKWLAPFQFCAKCGEPIENFLRKKKLIKE